MIRHRCWLGVALLAALGSAYAQSGEGTRPDAQKLVLENEFVRVFDIRLTPGAFEAKHSHARGLTIALSDYTNETTSFPDGKVSRGQARFGDVRWAEPVTHEARNTGTTEQHVIRIELKQEKPSSDSISPSDQLDSLLACKDTQKLIFENKFVRAIDDRIPAGVAEPKHRHAHGLTITLSDWDAETVTYPSGQTARRHATLGEVRWSEPLVHEVRNAGPTESHTVRIELK
jgi:predicted metal-dependent enzyme (double-stranded beta helix superfamily)